MQLKPEEVLFPAETLDYTDEEHEQAWVTSKLDALDLQVTELLKKIPKTKLVPLRAPGLVGEIADWITSTATRPQPLLSLAASLAFVGMLKGHRVCGGTDLRTNMLILSLAPTAGGKEHPQNAIKKLINICGLNRHKLGEPVSGKGFLTGLTNANRIGLLVMDEIGRYIQNLNGKNAGVHQREIIDYILKTFSCANSTLEGRQYGDEKTNPRIDIEQPHFCCLGSTVQERLQEACSSKEVIDGFLNRWLVFNVPKRAKRVDNPSKNPIPSALIDKITNFSPPMYDNYGNPTPKEIGFTPEAWDFFIKYRDKVDNLIEYAKYPIDKLYTRSSEHVEKLCLVLCDDEFIGTEDIICAIAIVEQSNKAIMEFAGLISDNIYEQDFNRVRDKIKQAKEIKRSELTYRCQFVQGGARRINEIIQNLIDQEMIFENKVGNKTFYVWCAS